ncbi:hypothetical protein FSP39_021255 [Pinctada imbricata]|uniref:IgGFc-binding protein N-terminal domain-containing protein n=1 Tax=Pinctada imbricata TaxID=66713 RepID=A0AA88XMI9_PINIB|nr:hypothetical protein FSP39_021255 [Pinctada imbricata]
MKMDGNAGAHIELLLVGTETGTADINIPYLNISQAITLPLGMTKYQVPKVIIPSNLHVEKKGIEIKSSVPMTLFAINMEGANSDGFSVIPVDKLGMEYFVPSTVGENEMTIVSPYDNNSVSVTMKMPLGDVTFNNKDYGNGDTFNVVLNKFDTLEVNAYDPYAGTKIVSSKPIALVSGDRCTGLEGVGCDHLLDMIPPTKSYSTDFIIPKLVDRKNSTVQIIASEGNTDINVNELSSGRQTHKNLASPGDHLDITVADLGVVSTSKKVLVTMFVHACCAPLYHEPFMMVVPGIDRYLPKYDFAVWDGGNRFQNHLTIVIPQGNEKGLMLDGSAVAPYTKEYTVTVKGVTYSVFGVLTNEGAHHMIHSKGVKFGLFVHGNTASNGYGYAAGMRMD